MATHDYVIDNSTGANVRADINNVLQAILTNNSNSSAPSTTAAYMLWADTTANIVKIRNSANNAWINLFTTAGGIDVDAASNFNEDVTFTGASYNVVWDKSDNALEFADNAKAIFGTGADLKIYHTGSQSRIENSGTGELRIQADDIQIVDKEANDFHIKCIHDGAVELYYDNSKKFETTSTGISVTGQVAATTDFKGLDNVALTLGTSSDLRILHDGTDNVITSDGGQSIRLVNHLTGGNESMIKCIPNGATELYYNGSKKFETTNLGAQVTGRLNVSGNFEQDDNVKANWGNSHDLQIYHDGSNSHLTNSTGYLLIHSVGGDSVFRSNNGVLLQPAGGENGVSALANGAVELYYDNSKKLETTSDGIKLPDAGKLSFNDVSYIWDNNTNNNTYWMNPSNSTYIDIADSSKEFAVTANGTAEAMIKGIPDAQVELYHNGSKRLETTAQGIEITGTDSGGGRVIPAADNAGYIGENNNRWIAVYAVNGSIQTSDRTEKNTIVESDLGLNFVNKLKPVSYKWNAKQLGNKTHYGLIAQDIEEAVKSEGKTLDDFAAVTKEDGAAMGLGYCELISPLIKAIQELSDKVAALEAA